MSKYYHNLSLKLKTKKVRIQKVYDFVFLPKMSLLKRRRLSWEQRMCQFSLSSLNMIFKLYFYLGLRHYHHHKIIKNHKVFDKGKMFYYNDFNLIKMNDCDFRLQIMVHYYNKHKNFVFLNITMYSKVHNVVSFMNIITK